MILGVLKKLNDSQFKVLVSALQKDLQKKEPALNLNSEITSKIIELLKELKFFRDTCEQPSDLYNNYDKYVKAVEAYQQQDLNNEDTRSKFIALLSFDKDDENIGQEIKKIAGELASLLASPMKVDAEGAGKYVKDSVAKRSWREDKTDLITEESIQNRIEDLLTLLPSSSQFYDQLSAYKFAYLADDDVREYLKEFLNEIFFESTTVDVVKKTVEEFINHLTPKQTKTNFTGFPHFNVSNKRPKIEEKTVNELIIDLHKIFDKFLINTEKVVAMGISIDLNIITLISEEIKKINPIANDETLKSACKNLEDLIGKITYPELQNEKAELINIIQQIQEKLVLGNVLGFK